MRRKRLFEVGLLLMVTAVAARWSVSSAPSGELKEFTYSNFPFQYSLRVEPDGSGTYSSSYYCVMATPEPGRLSCQHLEGKATRNQVDLLWARLRTLHPERFSSVGAGGNGPIGPPLGVTLRFGHSSVAVSDPKAAEELLKSLKGLHPDATLRELEQKRAAEAKALKQAQ